MEPISWLQSHFMVVQPQLTHLQPTCCQRLRDGWTNIVRMILKLRPGGLLIGGPPCSSWVWINRATSKRSAQRVMGDSHRDYVRDANTNLSSSLGNCVFYPLTSTVATSFIAVNYILCISYWLMLGPFIIILWFAGLFRVGDHCACHPRYDCI